jgi:hypothetical protein
MTTTRILVTVGVITATAVAGLAPAAGAAPIPVTVVVSVDRIDIRADGRDVATVTVDASTVGGPLANGTVRLSAVWTTPKSPGAAKFLPSTTVLLDGAGHGTATVTSTRSGTAGVTAKVATRGYVGSGSTPLVAHRRSVAVFVNGASSYTTCTAPGVCGDAFDLFGGIRAALIAQGFTANDLPSFGYAGGAIDPATHAWVPNASTCADSALDYKVQVGRLRTMLRQISSANPNTDLSLVGLSQGGLLVFQMLAAQTTPLPKGSRLANVITLDGVIAGIPLAQVLHLQTASGGATTCWSLGGTSKAATQVVAVWNTATPAPGPQQADRATVMCKVVGFGACALAGTNQQVLASRPDVHVDTWGSSQDGVYDPALCGIPGSWISGIDTQVVTGAGGGLHAEGLSPGPGCELASHTIVVGNRTSDVASTIGPQQ